MRLYVTTNLIKFTNDTEKGDYKYHNIAMFEIRNLGFEVVDSYPINRQNLDFVLVGLRKKASLQLKELLMYHSTTSRFYYIGIAIALGIFLIVLLIIVICSKKKKSKKGPGLDTSVTSSQMIELEHHEMEEAYEAEAQISSFGYRKRKRNRSVIKY